MGKIAVTNVTGTSISLQTFQINTQPIDFGQDTLPSGGTAEGTVGDDRFEVLEFNLTTGQDGNTVTYHINLTRNHWFGGGAFHYPESDTSTNLILTGYNTGHDKIQMRLAYSKTDSNELLYDNDAKYLERQ